MTIPTPGLWGPVWTPERPDVTRPMVEDPDRPDTLTGLELRLRREGLGLSAADLAVYLGVGLRTVQRWEKAPTVPAWADGELHILIAVTEEYETQLYHLAETIVHRGGWRMVEDRWVAEAWWRALVGRVLADHPALAVTEQP